MDGGFECERDEGLLYLRMKGGVVGGVEMRE